MWALRGVARPSDRLGGAYQLPPNLLWMHNGFGYIYDSVGLRADASQRAVPQKDANMSIEQFIDNEVKSNDVVLFMKERRSFRSAVFQAKWCRSSTTSGSATRASTFS